METLWIILLVAVVITVIIGLGFWVRNYRVNKRRKNVKIGDIRSFYIGDLRCRGAITTVWKNHVNIRHWTSKRVYRRLKTEIY